MASRLLLFAFFLLPATIQAAPAPAAKPARRVPSPGTLLANLRAEGYCVTAIQYGPEPGTYVVTVPPLLVAWGSDVSLDADTEDRTYLVRAASADVRADLRAFLEDPPSQGTLLRTDGKSPRERKP